MAYAHAHRPGSHESQKALYLAVLLTLGFAGVEAISGWLSGSLALMGDAGHMLTDGLSLAAAAFAAWLANRSPSAQHSYGLGRSELLAALFNAFFMIGIVVMISVAAVDRFINPRHVTGEAVAVVAFVGLLINIMIARQLSHSRDNINVRGALLHVMGDLLGSIAALISGVVIVMTGWYPIDPILSLLIVVLILFSSFRLLSEGLYLLLDGVPKSTDLNKVGIKLAEIDGVLEVHDLHIWSLSSENIALSAHFTVSDMSLWPQQLATARQLLCEQFHIKHVTLQPELSRIIDNTGVIK